MCVWTVCVYVYVYVHVHVHAHVYVHVYVYVYVYVYVCEAGKDGACACVLWALCGFVWCRHRYGDGVLDACVILKMQLMQMSCKSLSICSVCSLFTQAFAVIVTLSTPGGAAIPCTSGFAVLATVNFVASTPSGSQLTASVNVTMTCVPFAPTSPYRFTFVDEGDGSVQVRAQCPGVTQLSVREHVLDPTVLRYVG